MDKKTLAKMNSDLEARRSAKFGRRIDDGAFDGIEKVISKRRKQGGLGFGADVVSRDKEDRAELLADIQPHDLLKFGIIKLQFFNSIAPSGKISRLLWNKTQQFLPSNLPARAVP